MGMNLFDPELKVMDALRKSDNTPAKEIAKVLTDEVGWNVNTTYTLIKRRMKKGAIQRSEPGFLCHALISKSVVQEAEIDELISKVYDGSADKLFAASQTTIQAMETVSPWTVSMAVFLALAFAALYLSGAA